LCSRSLPVKPLDMACGHKNVCAQDPIKKMKKEKKYYIIA
jgi:hypothetical protein